MSTPRTLSRTTSSGTSYRNCEGVTRRHCLQLGLGAMLGGGVGASSGIGDLLRWRALSAAEASPGAKPKTACILLWLDGGPTHYETFDPKPDAPREIRGDYEAIPTRVPGVYFSQHLRRLADINERFAVIRSIRHDHGNHGAGNHYMMTGAPTRIPVACGAFVSFHPSLGSVTARDRSATTGDATSALPRYFSLPRMSRSGGPNFLGARYAPFVVPDDPNRSSFRVRDVALPAGLTEDRFASRRDLRSRIDRFLRIEEESAGDPVAALDQYYTQAWDLVSSRAAQQAFDIHREAPRTRERYGRSALGQRMLLARRLVESGVPFVTVYDGGWDHHVKIFDGLNRKLPPVDQALAALIEDLEQRGLLESTLVLALGEFGRTPKINDRGGRDHWSNAMSVLMAGCGTPGGAVVGATDAQGYSASERVLSPENFASTVYTKLGIDPNTILYTPEGRPVHLVSDPTPIRELL